MSVTNEKIRQLLMARAAVLFFLSMVTGLWAGIVLSHGHAIGLELTPPRHERLALEAHIGAMLGTFWMLGVAFTLEHTRFGESGRRRLAQVVTLVAFGDWAVTMLASVLDVQGIDFGGDAANKIVAGLFQLLVVLPSLAASAAWAYGLRPAVRE